MELHIKSEFECVYSINGVFYERADSLTMSEYDVVYVTVFPLKHTLLPYTVKLCGAENVSDGLCRGIRLDSDNYMLELASRHIAVYGTQKAAAAPQSSQIARLFALIKNGDVAAAYDMLTDELKASIDKPDLEAFFNGYEHLTECYWDGGKKFYLIDKNGVPKLHSYTLKDEFIDNITEL